MKHIIIAGLLLAIFMGTGSAWYGTNVYCWDNGDEYGAYTVSGVGGNYRIGYHSSENAVTLFYYHNMVSKDGATSAYITGSQWDNCAQGGANWYQIPSSRPRFGTAQVTTQSWELYANNIDGYGEMTFVIAPPSTGYDYINGNLSCVSETNLYIQDGASYIRTSSTTEDTYCFPIIDGATYRILFDGAYYDFTSEGENITLDYDACIYVYGYTCGVDNIKLYNDTGGWVLDDSVGQSTGYDVYEMAIEAGEYYKISFIDSTIDGDFVVHNQTFSCIGDHVLIDFDRCQWIYPPNPPAPPYIIYLWTGYDYNIVVFKDEHGNFIENSQLAIYDMTDDKYLQRWTDASDGYALLGAKFATDHDVQLMLRTFDGIFTLDTTFPANGSAAVGEEAITTTNWTIPIKYNLNVLPVDQYGASLFDVFCGLSEYTPLNPGAFWGMDLSDQGYVAVTNCSGFAMCDIIAEKDGYADYMVEALNWTSKSALVKDYRHNVVMEEE